MKPDPRQHIYERDGFTCRYCGWRGRDSFDAWLRGSLTIDHVVPRKHGGTDDDSNLVVACHVCNQLKGSSICSSIEEGRRIIDAKRLQYQRWYLTYVQSDKVDNLVAGPPTVAELDAFMSAEVP